MGNCRDIRNSVDTNMTIKFKFDDLKYAKKDFVSTDLVSRCKKFKEEIDSCQVPNEGIQVSKG